MLFQHASPDLRQRGQKLEISDEKQTNASLLSSSGHLYYVLYACYAVCSLKHCFAECPYACVY